MSNLAPPGTFDKLVLDGLRRQLSDLENQNRNLAAQNAIFREALACYAKDYDTGEFGMAAMTLELPVERVVKMLVAAQKIADKLADEDIDMSHELFEAYQEYVVAREGL